MYYILFSCMPEFLLDIKLHNHDLSVKGRICRMQKHLGGKFQIKVSMVCQFDPYYCYSCFVTLR